MFSYDKFTLLTLSKKTGEDRTMHHVSLFEDGIWVAQCTIYSTSSSVSTISDIEVHPDHRGRKLSSELVQRAKETFGPLELTGYFGIAGKAASKHWGLEVRAEDDVFVSTTENYEFYDWTRAVYHETENQVTMTQFDFKHKLHA